MRIVLKQERKLYILKNYIPHVLADEAKTEYQCHIDDNK